MLQVPPILSDQYTTLIEHRGSPQSIIVMISQMVATLSRFLPSIWLQSIWQKLTSYIYWKTRNCSGPCKKPKNTEDSNCSAVLQVCSSSAISYTFVCWAGWSCTDGVLLNSYKNSKKKADRIPEKTGSACCHFISSNATWLGRFFYRENQPVTVKIYQRKKNLKLVFWLPKKLY